MGLYRGQTPYGEIFKINTAPVDNITRMLYARQQQKEQQEKLDNQALDNEFSRNMSGMRDVDIPDLTKAYGDFKLAHIGLQKKGNKVTPEDQIELLRKKAAVNQVIASSKAQKEQEKQFGTSVMKDPNKYVRDAHGKLIGIMNTPVSKLGDVDPFAELPYKGNLTNLTKILGIAAGKEIKMEDEVVDNPKELRKDVTHVSRMANAKEYYDNILGQVVGSQGEDDLVRSVASNITPELYNSTKLQYEQMMADPVLRKRLGMDKVDLPPDEGLTEPQRAAKYLAMTHQLVAKPTLKEGSPIYSRVGIMDKQFANQKTMEDIRQANREKLIPLREAAKQAGEAANDLWVETYIDKLGEDAAASPNKNNYTKGGKTVTENSLPVDAVMAKIFTRDGLSPDRINVTNNYTIHKLMNSKTQFQSLKS